MKKNIKTKPQRISYEVYASLRNLITVEKKRLEENWQVACSFIPSEPYRSGQISTVEKLHKIFSERYRKLNVMEEELHLAASAMYKDHPNPKMREFWGCKK